MRRSSTAFIVVLVSVLVSSFGFQATAQESNPRGSHDIFVSRRYAPPEAAHRHSSTAYEGARRGEAAWITAEGEFLNDEAQAAILWQNAETLHYQNKLNKTAAALTRKQMLDGYRDYKRQRRFDRKEQSKQLWQEKYQELARTYRLNEYQLNWKTGAIYWPASVASPRYAKHRQRLDILIDRIVRYDQSSNRFTSDEITKVCKQFRNQLKKELAAEDTSARQSYSEAQRFLLGLKYAPLLLQSGGKQDQATTSLAMQ